MAIKLFGGSSPTWIAAFLGNPGSKFEQTRHNMGFMTADALAKELDVKINRVKFEALTGTVRIGEENVLLLKPQTYMNLSGESVHAAASFYKIPPERIIVVVDDMNIPAGRLRIRPSGSDGGHNGLKNITAHLHTDAYPRIRIGIGRPPVADYDVIDWVISHMSDDEVKALKPAIDRAVKAVSEIVLHGVSSAMDKYNRAF